MGEGAAGARRPVRASPGAEDLRLEGLVVEKRLTRVETTRYLVIDFRRGSVAVYKKPPPKAERPARRKSAVQVASSVTSSLARAHSTKGEVKPHLTCENLAHISRGARHFSGAWDPKFAVSSHVDWKIRDVENDETMFYLVLPPDFKEKDADAQVFSMSKAGRRVSYRSEMGATSDLTMEGGENEGLFSLGSSVGSQESGQKYSSDLDDTTSVPLTKSSPRKGLSSIFSMKKKHSSDKHEVVYMFRVLLDGNEKFIWLQAAAELGRLSDEKSMRMVANINTLDVTKKIFDLSGVMGSGQANLTALRYAEWAMLIDRSKSVSTHPFDVRDVGSDPQAAGNERSVEGGSNYDATRLVKVIPTYAYRNRRMTEKDLYNEMTTTSEKWEDFRRQPVGDREEEMIGSLHAEILACHGLPKLDKLTSTDAVCYFVCGPYAFATDVIEGFNSPVWPSKSRRACIFPIFHAYQKLFVGVFDDDGLTAKDDFAGRVVVDIARLRPNSMYDVYLPLRQYQNTFVQKPRGVIRLRLRVEWENERKALLSYLKLPTKTQELGNAVTLNCADQKAFRNAVLTVQGKDIPGKYKQLVQKALLREMKLYKMAMQAIVKEQIQAIVLYMNPSTSLCVFSAWMHCVYSNSMAYLPVYFVAGTIALLLRNYFKYGANDEFNFGFTPITLSELTKVLLFGGPNTKYIKPIKVARKNNLANSIARGSRDELDGNDEDIMPHSSMVDSGTGFSMDGDHLEFPFSEAGRYPKRTLKEACVDASAIFEEDDDEDSKPSGRFAALIYGKSKKSAQGIRIPKADRGDGDDEDEEDEFGLTVKSSIPQPNASTLQPVNENSGQNTGQEGGGKVRRSGSNESTAPIADMPWKRVKDSRGLPEQNATINVKARKSLPEELTHNKNLLQKYSNRMFDDRMFIVNDNDPGHTDAAEVILHQAIGTHKYSNPVVARIAAFVAPFLEMLKIGLSAFRSMFNLFTWRDPFLTSLFFFGAVLLLCVLLVFPWRWFFFLMGVGAVGPQNWVLRVAGKLPPKKKSKEDASKKSEKNSKKKKTWFPGASNNFQFHNHLTTDAGIDERQKKSDKSKVSLHRAPTHSVHRAVVPNSPLISRRFYDWPPNPALSKVDICEKEKGDVVCSY